MAQMIRRRAAAGDRAVQISANSSPDRLPWLLEAPAALILETRTIFSFPRKNKNLIGADFPSCIDKHPGLVVLGTQILHQPRRVLCHAARAGQICVLTGPTTHVTQQDSEQVVRAHFSSLSGNLCPRFFRDVVGSANAIVIPLCDTEHEDLKEIFVFFIK